MDDILFLLIGQFVLCIIMIVFLSTRYRRCPAGKILVVSGAGNKPGESVRCISSGGVYVWPLVQTCDYLSLAPITVEIESYRITVCIDADPECMKNAATRLLGLSEDRIRELVSDVVSTQMRESVSGGSETDTTKESIQPVLTLLGLKVVSLAKRR